MAASALATAFVNIVPGTKDLETYLKNKLPAEASEAGDKAGNEAGDKMGKGIAGKLKSMVGPALLAAGAAVIGNFAKDAVTAASDFGESANAVNVMYGTAAGDIAKLGEDAATRLGLTSTEFNQIATQFSSFGGLIAGPGGDIAGVIDDLSTRGADFASVMNLGVNDALGLFQSGLAGESEPLRKYGLDLSAAAVEAYAMANGIGTSGEALTEAEKVQARYGLLMEGTSKTQGDFANTSDGLANQQRILAAQFTELQIQVGTALLPAFAAVASFANDVLIPAFSAAFGWIMDNVPTIATFVGVLGGLLIIFNAVAIATKLWAIAQGILNAVMAINPLTLLAIAIAAVVAAIVWVATQTTFFQDAWAVMTAAVTAAWEAVVGFFETSFAAIGDFFGGLIDGIVAGWESFVGLIDTGLQAIGGFFEAVFTGVGDFIKGAINGYISLIEGLINSVIDVINWFVKQINKIKIDVPDWVTELTGINDFGFNLSTLSKVNLPRLAMGGYVDRPTTALIGEAGPEVVVPLDRFERMVGLDGSGGKVINYYAAPNNSLDAEQDLVQAMRRVKVVANW